MNPFKLEGTTPAGKAARVWVCGKCERTCQDEQHAIQCCAPYTCRTCGKESRQYHFVCDECRRLEAVAQERAQYDKAKKIAAADYTHDMVYMPSGDYVSLEDALGQVDDEFGSTWAWGCTEKTPHLDAESIIENLCEDLYEDAYEQFDVEKLQKLLDEYIAEEFATARCYEDDHSTVVILKDDEEE